MNLPTDIMGFIIVILGVIGRIYVSWINPPSGGIESFSDIHIIVGGSSPIFLLVGGIISTFGAVRYKERKWGITGVILAAIFLVLTFLRPWAVLFIREYLS